MEKIIKNSIQCKHCGDILVSQHVHDFVKCKCGCCFADGGHDYLRRGYRTSAEEDFIELSIWEEVPDNEDDNVRR